MYLQKSSCFADVTSATITWNNLHPLLRLLGTSNRSSYHYCSHGVPVQLPSWTASERYFVFSDCGRLFHIVVFAIYKPVWKYLWVTKVANVTFSIIIGPNYFLQWYHLYMRIYQFYRLYFLFQNWVLFDKIIYRILQQQYNSFWTWRNVSKPSSFSRLCLRYERLRSQFSLWNKSDNFALSSVKHNFISSFSFTRLRNIFRLYSHQTSSRKRSLS